MLKEFIEHIQKTTQPLITTVNGSTFCVTSDGNTEELLPTIFHPYTLDLNSLDALVTMVRTEASEMDAPLYIAVPDCKTVRCFGQSRDYDERCFRQVYYEAHATDVPGWDQKVTLGFEEAQIALRTRFQETPDTLYAMKLVSDISLGAKVIYNDIIVLLVLLCSLLSGTAEHNTTALELCFHGGVISASVPEDYRGHIENMRDSFFVLDGGAAELDGQMENGDSLDRTRVKAIFYALYFGEEQPSQRAHKQYLDCFVTYEERTRTVTEADDAGNEVEVEETYTVAVPIRDLSVVYENIRSKMGTEITAEDQANATEIYYRILCGGPAPTYGSEFDIWSDGLPLSDAPFIGADGFCSPIGESWRSVVTSEFGWRKDPFTGKGAGHTGIDLGMPKGTPIRAALTGTVYLVRYSTTGYGYHVMIDHGGGFVTLYAHCSKLLVAEGQQVQAGDIIAEVGSTGRSTGNHLHFEVRINGEKQNPRSYLP